jgi:MSHA pilin protein MshA
MNKKGFTLIELVLVITILAIVAISALPNFTDVTTKAEAASMDTVVGAIQTGLQIYRSNDMTVNGPPGTYPAQLDPVTANTACASSSPCFGAILISPVGDFRNGRGWTKVSDTSYSFNDGSQTYSYTYDPAAGTFSR